MSNPTSFSAAAEYQRRRRQAAIPSIDFSRRRVVDANGHRAPYSAESPFTMSTDNSSEFSMVDSPTPAAARSNFDPTRVPLVPATRRAGHHRNLTPLAFDRFLTTTITTTSAVIGGELFEDGSRSAQSLVIHPVAERAPVDGHRDESPVAGISPVDLALSSDDSFESNGRQHAGVANDNGTPIGLSTNTETQRSKRKIITKAISGFFNRLRRGKGAKSPSHQQQHQEDREERPSAPPSSSCSSLRIIQHSEDKEEELLAQIAAITFERDQRAHALPRACGTAETRDLSQTIGLAETLVSQYRELVGVVDGENGGLRSAITEAKEETIKVHRWVDERAARFREEREIHEGNLAMAKTIIVEQEKRLVALEAEVEEAAGKRREAEEGRVFEGYLRDLRNGATFGETGEKFYGRRRAASN